MTELHLQKNKWLISILCCITSYTAANQPQPITINQINNNSQQLSLSPVFQQGLALYQQATESLKAKKDSCFSIINNALDYMVNNKKTTLLYSLAISYTTITCVLWYLQTKIDQCHWVLWKRETGLEHLLSVRQQDLAQQLLLDIQMKYINPLSPTDTTEPITKFLYDIKQEEQLIATYLKILTALDRIGISRFLCITTHRQKYEEYATRLNCVKALFAFWLSEYKVSLLKEKTTPQASSHLL